MSTIEHLETPISRRPRLNAATDLPGHKDDAIALRRRAAGSSFFWAMRLLPRQRRRAMNALYAFCREVGDIADGEASRSLKQTLLLNWRSEIAHLYAGRPRHTVTRSLNEAIHLYGLRWDDFLAIIDGMEMDARTDIRAPSFAELDLYCERVAVAVGRISVRIFGEASPAGERVAAELPGVAAHQYTSRSRRGCEATPAIPASRAIARARHIRNHAELGAGAAGASRSVPRSRRARRTALRSCRGGNCRLPSLDDAPSGRDARPISRPSPRASRARLAAARQTSTNPFLAQTGSSASSWADGPLKTAVPRETASARCASDNQS